MGCRACRDYGLGSELALTRVKNDVHLQLSVAFLPAVAIRLVGPPP